MANAASSAAINSSMSLFDAMSGGPRRITFARDTLLVEIEGVGCRPGFSPAKPEAAHPG